jgi:hypothetical protein
LTDGVRFTASSVVVEAARERVLVWRWSWVSGPGPDAALTTAICSPSAPGDASASSATVEAANIVAALSLPFAASLTWSMERASRRRRVAGSP